MTIQGAFARHPSFKWGVRWLLALTCAVAGYVAATKTLAQVLQSSDSDQAHTLAPNNARINAVLAEKLATDPHASPADQQRARRLAVAALRGDPTAVAAASALGIEAQRLNDTSAARRLFAYAQTLSRRELVAQLWAIEDAVSRNDVPGAIRHYDIALRTSRTASNILFPVLAAAIADPVIQVVLTRTLAKNPAWRDGFVNYVGTQGPIPEATVTLFTRLQRAAVPVPEIAQGGAVNALIQKGQFDRAWAYYALIRPGADRLRSRDPGFTAALEAPTPLDWGVVDVVGGSTSIQRGANGNFFDFAASPSVGGILLQQVQLLPAGNYRLAGHSINIDQTRDALPYWTLTCRDGRVLGRVNVLSSAQANGSFFAGRLSVPGNCPMQVLTLVARPSNSIGGVSGQIDRVQLAPL